MASSRTVGVIQLNSGGDREANFRRCERLVKTAFEKAKPALVCLPECAHWIGETGKEGLAVAERLEESHWIKKYGGLAKEYGCWLSLAGFPEVAETNEQGECTRRFNTQVIWDEQGAIRAVYRKIHLFDASVEGHGSIRESQFTAPGRSRTTCTTPVGQVGLTTCYDLRFPGLYEALRHEDGCDALLVPSAFTKPTGEAHWEPLLRARAIETQCYVIAPALVGRHNASRESHGHAMVIDPWGRVIAHADDGREDEAVVLAEVDHSGLDKARAAIPVAGHRRPNVYVSN